MMGACQVEGCTKDARALKMCWGHYNRLRVHGDPLKGRPRAENGEGKKWLEDHVNHKGKACLIWPFSHDAKMKVGRVKVDDGYESSYRYMCILAHGAPVGERQTAAHSCGNGDIGCVNPDHLRWATDAENMADKAIHGTLPKGEGCYNSKLTETDVRFIRDNADLKQKDLSRMFGVHIVTISQIIARKRWAHID